MKKNPASESGAFRLRVLLAFVLCTVGVFIALMGFGTFTSSSALAQDSASKGGGDVTTKSGITWGTSYKNDVSPALRSLPPWPVFANKAEHEANPNPLMIIDHVDVPDPVIQNASISALALLSPNIPLPIANFDGIPAPGVVCNCSPPDTNGAVGTTQYVQMVNEGIQVWNKAGVSVLGPVAISTIWAGFGGVCESGNSGDPIVMFDRIANRWVISQFRPGTGFTVPTDQCIAVSTTSDATGTWNRYGFHIGTGNFMDYPHGGVWPDAYYFAFNVFNSAGSARLGPQAFAFDRAKMVAGTPGHLRRRATWA